MQTLSRIPLTDFIGIPYFHDHRSSITSSFEPGIALIYVFQGIFFLFRLFIDKKALSSQMME